MDLMGLLRYCYTSEDTILVENVEKSFCVVDGAAGE